MCICTSKSSSITSEQLGNFTIICPSCPKEGSFILTIPGIDIHSLLQQVLDNFLVAVVGCNYQRGVIIKTSFLV